jgi:hypothetical protein
MHHSTAALRQCLSSSSSSSGGGGTSRTFRLPLQSHCTPKATAAAAAAAVVLLSRLTPWLLLAAWSAQGMTHQMIHPTRSMTHLRHWVVLTWRS